MRLGGVVFRREFGMLLRLIEVAGEHGKIRDRDQQRNGVRRLLQSFLRRGDRFIIATELLEDLRFQVP